MTLEEEIKQSHFPNEFEKAFVNLIFTANHHRALNVKRLKSFGLSPEQYNVLRILRGSHPKKLRISDISDRMLDRNSNATRLIEKLRLKDLVTREGCLGDRRQVEIGINQKGLDVLEEIDRHAANWFKSLLKLDPQEVTTLNILLDKLRA